MSIIHETGRNIPTHSIIGTAGTVTVTYRAAYWPRPWRRNRACLLVLLGAGETLLRVHAPAAGGGGASAGHVASRVDVVSSRYATGMASRGVLFVRVTFLPLECWPKLTGAQGIHHSHPFSDFGPFRSTLVFSRINLTFPSPGIISDSGNRPTSPT